MTQDRPLEIDEIPIPVPLLLHPQVRMVDLRVFAYLYGSAPLGGGVVLTIDDLILATGAEAKTVWASLRRLRDDWGIIDAESVGEEHFRAELLPRPWAAFEGLWRTRLESLYHRRFPSPEEIEDEVEHQVREQLLTYWCLRMGAKVSPLTGEYRQEQPDGTAGPALYVPSYEELIAMYPEVEPTFRQMAREYVGAVAGLRPEPRPLPW